MTVRAAVIGMGGMGLRHLAALEGLGASILAVCDRSSAALGKAPATARRYDDWRALLDRESPEIDVLTVATNGPSHHDIVVAAAQSGIRAVLCEKPMTTSGEKARAMAAACAASGTRLAVNMSRRFADRFQRLRSMLARGTIGRPLHVNVSVGAGGLGCIGTHYFDLVSWLGDTRAAWVTGEVDRNPTPNVRGAEFTDPGGRGLVGYRNGMTACFQLLGDAAITPLMQIVGTDGFVDFDGWTPGTGGRANVYARPEDQRHVPKTRFVEPRRVAFDLGDPMDVVAATRECLRDLLSGPSEDTVTAGIEAVDTVMAFHLSARRDWAKVALPLLGEDLRFEVAIT